MPARRKSADPVGLLQTDINRLFDDFLQTMPLVWPGASFPETADLKVDVSDTGKAIRVTATVSGGDTLARAFQALGFIVLARAVGQAGIGLWSYAIVFGAYAVMLVRATRPTEEGAFDFIRKYLTWGAGTRACQALLLGARPALRP